MKNYTNKILNKWHNVGPYYLSPDKFKKIQKKLFWDFSNITVIHVSGTNGKGSCCNYLNNVLEQESKVGLFTSPHLITPTERIKINGTNIAENKLHKIISDNEDIINEFQLNYFEIYALSAIIYFLKNKVATIILEAGIGAKYDTTNFLKADYTLLTSVSKDHCEILGKSLMSIGFQKIGNIKFGKQICTCSIESKKLFIFLKIIALFRFHNLHNTYYKVKKIRAVDKNIYFELNNIKWMAKLGGIYQAYNLSQCIYILSRMGYDKTFIKRNILSNIWPGRFERLEENTYIEAAHNIEGIKYFIMTLKLWNINFKDVGIIFCSMEDKNPSVLLKKLKKYGFGNVYITEMDSKRSMKIKDIKPNLYNQKNMEWQKLASKSRKQCKYLFFIGSIQFIGDIKKYYQRSK